MTSKDEDLDSFRRRARTWVTANLGPVGSQVSLQDAVSEEEELAAVQRERQVQRALFDAGFAGICFPKEYGGLGLTPPYQNAFNEALAGHEFPSRLQVPTLSPCAAVLLEFGTEAQKRQHIPAILRGEELWMQLLSEPGGGSDVAGAVTTAVRDGDEWILNGSKIWTTGAWWSDWGLCLARTNWDVPKHRGLTVFILPLRQPGLDVHRIEMLNGSREFCQEFLSDVRVPDSDRVGDIDDGWTVGIRWLFHERMLYNSPLVSFPAGSQDASSGGSLLDLARCGGVVDDSAVRERIGEARVLDVVGNHLQDRISTAVRSGHMTDQAAAIVRLFKGIASARHRTLGFDIAGAAGGTWLAQDGATAHVGVDFLMRQVTCIGGGTTEMARNVISERVLGMPREPVAGRELPYREVPRGASIRRR